MHYIPSSFVRRGRGSDDTHGGSAERKGWHFNQTLGWKISSPESNVNTQLQGERGREMAFCEPSENPDEASLVPPVMVQIVLLWVCRCVAASWFRVFHSQNKCCDVEPAWEEEIWSLEGFTHPASYPSWYGGAESYWYHKVACSHSAAEHDVACAAVCRAASAVPGPRWIKPWWGNLLEACDGLMWLVRREKLIWWALAFRISRSTFPVLCFSSCLKLLTIPGLSHVTSAAMTQ